MDGVLIQSDRKALGFKQPSGWKVSSQDGGFGVGILEVRFDLERFIPSEQIDGLLLLGLRS